MQLALHSSAFYKPRQLAKKNMLAVFIDNWDSIVQIGLLNLTIQHQT